MKPLVKKQSSGLARLFRLPCPSQQPSLPRVSRQARGGASSSDDYTDYIEILEACPELKNAKDGLTLKQKISYFQAVKKYQSNSGKFAKFAQYLFCEIPTTGYNVGEDLSDCLEVFCDYLQESEVCFWNQNADSEERAKIANLAPCVKSVVAVPLYSLSELQKRNCLRFLTRLRAPEEVTFGFLTRKTQWHPAVVVRSVKDFMADPCVAMISTVIIASCLLCLFLFSLPGGPLH
jgi:hypothetical protein